MPKHNGYLMILLGFEGPTTEGQAKVEIKNYIRRVRSYRETHGLDTKIKKLQYAHAVITALGWSVGTVIMTGMEMKAAEALWKKGGAVVQVLETNETPPKVLAAAMKSIRPASEWTSSKGMKSRYLKHTLQYLNKGVAV